MRPDQRPRRFSYDPRPSRRTPRAAPPETRDGPPFPFDELFRDGPAVDEVDEAIDQIASEGCRACPRCGRIAPRGGRGPRRAGRPPRSPRPGLG